MSTTPASGTVSPGTSVHACDFEANNICGYMQDTTDNFNWTRTTKATATIGTGPSNDHTYGTSNGIVFPFFLRLKHWHVCVYMHIFEDVCNVDTFYISPLPYLHAGGCGLI